MPPELTPIPTPVLSVGFAVGEFRTTTSRLAGMVGTTKSGEASGTQDVPSAIAEAWVYYEYGVSRGWPWRPFSSIKGERDVGPVEVQFTQPGRNLILRQHDIRSGVPLSTPYVLVWLEPDFRAGAIVGWHVLGEYEDARQMYSDSTTPRLIDWDALLPMSKLDEFMAVLNPKE